MAAGPVGNWPARAAEEPSAAKDLAEKSLPLRTALHHDPSLASPLTALLSLYRKAGKTDELIGLYRAHVDQYPNDASGRTVLVRLLTATGNAESLGMARAASQQFPDDAYLHYLLYEVLRRKRDPEALEHLDKAVELESRPGRKLARIDALLPIAVVEGRRDLAQKHLRALADLVGEPDEHLLVAQKMLKFKFHQLALELLEKPPSRAPSPETMVSIELEAATAEVGLDRMEAAGARLDRLLAKLTADYWRRDEIVRRRLALVKTQAERTRMIAAARKRAEDHPNDVAAVLDLAQVLAGLQLRRDALTVLIEAGDRLPKSMEIEKQILEVLDRLRDERGRQQYLARRIKAQPQRSDLVLLHVKTLYLLGRREEALAELTGLADGLDPGQRAVLLLETARFLRRSAMLADAAELFRRVVDAAPERLDVRRELAETFLASGDRYRVRELFTAEVEKQASLENLLDLVQFMIQQELFIEARRALIDRVGREKANLEIRMLLLTVHRRLGNFRNGEELIDRCRELADTAARYRLWLESAAVFHDDFETLEGFLEAEQARLEEEPGGWTPRRLERRLAFAAIAARSGRATEAVAMLEADLQSDLPENGRGKIRRQLIKILDQQQHQAAAVQRHLADLAADEPQQADECNARLALLHAKAKRPDLATPLLNKLDVARIQDPAIVSALPPLYRQLGGNREKILAVLERLTVLDPTNADHWQQWIGMLATTGEESRLRSALRRLLAGVEKLPISEETRTLIEQHVVDSYWRSIAERLADGRDSSLADTLALLDSVDRTASNDEQALWIAWSRAYLLGRLDRPNARQQAVEEFDRIAARLPGESEKPDPETGSDAAGRIAFPDGLSISLEHAHTVLEEITAAGTAVSTEPPQGPLPPLEVKWTFQLGPKAAVTEILPLDASRTLICEATGNAYCVDAANGKLLWRTSTAPISGSRPSLPHHVSPHALMDDRGRLYLSESTQVACRAVEDGRLLWCAQVGASGDSAQGSPPPGRSSRVAMFLQDEKLLTYEPASGTLTRIDPDTGKIVWDHTVAGKGKLRIEGFNCGASLSGDRLLIYGSRTAILDARTGQVLWSLEPSRVRKLPVELHGSPNAVSMPSRSGVGRYPSPPQRGRGSSILLGSSSRASQPVQYVDYSQPTQLTALPPGGVRFVPPAVAWASLVSQGTPRRGELIDRLLLLWNASSVWIIHTDLPLAGKYVPVPGSYVGMAGRTVCLLDNQRLSLVDVTDGALKPYELKDIAGRAPVPFQAAIDGPLVYVTGPGGIVCVKAATAERVFHAPWPKEVTPPEPPEVLEPVASTSSSFASTGRPYVSGPYSIVTPVPPHSHSSSGAPQAPVLVLPSVSCVARGVLYTLVTPNRVVAWTAERQP